MSLKSKEKLPLVALSVVSVEMVIVGSRYKHSRARELMVVAMDKIKELLREEGGH